MTESKRHAPHRQTKPSVRPTKASAQPSAELTRGDAELLQTLDGWFARAAAKAGTQLACKPGCAQCCVGAFALDRLDALRLQRGLSELQKSDPDRARRIVERSADWLDRQSEFFPGSLETGRLDTTPEAEELFAEFANDEPCPALDPESQRCDLYAHRPLTCRLFGPPLESEGGIGVCELCFTQAPSEQIQQALVPLEGEALEAKLNRAAERTHGPGQTIVAFALLGA